MRGEYPTGIPRTILGVELPPRARRILTNAVPKGTAIGTTSACAENTTGGPGRTKFRRNYLRVRGEYKPYQYGGTGNPELPPRARRIQTSRFQLCACKGTTSACAENTFPESGRNPHARNYLRVRGEYSPMAIGVGRHLELPPRARRIPPATRDMVMKTGTTSACAENTGNRVCVSVVAWNYLRVRGEYTNLLVSTTHPLELPPRARRIPQPGTFAGAVHGTTSACAENTCRALNTGITTLELPPRARRIPHETRSSPLAVGTTSACAENTTGDTSARSNNWNYLRVRGEYPK